MAPAEPPGAGGARGPTWGATWPALTRLPSRPPRQPSGPWAETHTRLLHPGARDGRPRLSLRCAGPWHPGLGVGAAGLCRPLDCQGVAGPRAKRPPCAARRPLTQAPSQMPPPAQTPSPASRRHPEPRPEAAASGRTAPVPVPVPVRTAVPLLLQLRSKNLVCSAVNRSRPGTRARPRPPQCSRPAPWRPGPLGTPRPHRVPELGRLHSGRCSPESLPCPLALRGPRRPSDSSTSSLCVAAHAEGSLIPPGCSLCPGRPSPTSSRTPPSLGAPHPAWQRPAPACSRTSFSVSHHFLFPPQLELREERAGCIVGPLEMPAALAKQHQWGLVQLLLFNR